MFTALSVLAVLILFVLYITIVIVPMRESYVVERLGKFHRVLNPGFYVLIPFVDRIAYRLEIREQVYDIPPQTCITQDNMQVKVDGLVYLKITDPKKACYGIGNYKSAAVNLAQTTMRSEIGKLTLSNTFAERETLNDKIVKEIDRASEPWGIKVMRYEIKNLSPSERIITTLEKQMEAERAKRAEITLATANKESKIILSEGLRTSAINLSEGEKQKRINLAKGTAQEITLLANASAKGIEMVAAAISDPSGPQAVKMKLVEQFIEQVGKVMKDANVSVLPAEMANVKAFFEGAEKMTRPLK